MSTVGYGDFYCETYLGKVFIMIFLGVAVVSTVLIFFLLLFFFFWCQRMNVHHEWTSCGQKC